MATVGLFAVCPARLAAQAPDDTPSRKETESEAEADAAVSEDEGAAETADAADEGAAGPADDALQEAEPAEEKVDPTDVSDEGVPKAPVEADKALVEVEKAVKKVEESSELGLPDEYTIEFVDSFDWVRLSSGEWLKGEFHYMRDKEFEFDSADIDLVTDEWSKVRRLHAPRIHTYAFEDGTDLVGRAVVTPEEVIVETVDGVVTRPRSELLAIVEGGRRERDWWYLRIGAGFSASAGNTSQGSLNGNFELGRADQRSVSKLTYDGTVGYADREETVNRHTGRAEVRIFFSQRLYAVPLVTELFNDRFANIRLRARPGVAGGVHLFDEPKIEWDLELSLGYQFLRFLSTIDGVKNPQSDAFVGLFNRWSFDIGKALDLDLAWQTSLVMTTLGNTNHQGSAVVSVEITEAFDFDVSFLFYRTERPAPRSDGTVPQKNDYQLVVGLTIEIG